MVTNQSDERGKPFLIIQLRPEDGPANSEFEAILRYGGLSEDDVVRSRAEISGLPDIELSEYAAIIVGGSPFDLTTPENEKTDIQKTVEQDFKQLFEKIIPLDFPFLGACSGNGLLGEFCGAKISTKYAEPVGGADITLTEAGTRDPLLSGLPRTFRVLLGHKEACDITPPGTVLLAGSNACPVQMFRLGQNIYATQFHPEGDLECFTIRVNAYKHYGYFEPEAAEALIASIAKEKTPVAQQILARFVNRYRNS